MSGVVPAWYAGYAGSACLLAAGGILKIARPDDTVHALAALGLPHHRVAVQIGAAAELAIAAAAVVVGGWAPALLVALSYLAFAGFVTAAWRNDSPVASCGCFGEADAPPTVLHAVANLAAATVAALTALVGPAPGLDDVVRSQPASGLPLVALTAIVAYLLFLVMAVLPRTTAAARGLS